MIGPDRLNRVVLTLLALLLIGAGGYGLARTGGILGNAQEPLVSGIDDFVARNSEWFWLVVALIALLVAYLGYRWLKAQIPAPERVGSLDLTRQGVRGYTRVRAGGAAAALAADVERHHGVEAARARFTSDGHAPEAELRASVFDSVDVPELVRHIGETSLERLRSMLDADSLKARVLLRLRDSPAERRVD